MAGIHTLNELTIHALLDNDQKTLDLLPPIVKLIIGKTCPLCDNTDADTIQWSMRQEDDAYCDKCEEWFSIQEHAQEAFEEAKDQYLSRRKR